MNRLTLDTEDRVFFYEQEFYMLSNFSSFRINWEEPYGVFDFDTSEHAYHFLRFPKGSEHRANILNARSAHEAFRYAQDNKKHQVEWWDKPSEGGRLFKVVKMKQVLWQKVEQHEYVKRKLLETGDRMLIENSWRDGFWGWGPNRDGQNWLGVLWMEIRTVLKRRSNNEAKVYD